MAGLRIVEEGQRRDRTSEDRTKGEASQRAGSGAGAPRRHRAPATVCHFGLRHKLAVEARRSSVR
eukprot:5445596-Prymnesium_polylepis.1